MTTSEIVGVIQAAMIAAMKLAAPVLLGSMAVGLIVSIFQAATQIHEQSLSFVPKLIVIALILVILGPWMMETMNDFVKYIFDMIVRMN
ncbi:flagellar biosynthesis protein FliQ [Caproiciproducens sp. LBM24188]|jgi:flagellar biosynthetic protein FliQ|nr:flagellar biosynthesis protein FliQ [Oscillospiraceae bacterium]HHV31934.1 flagellar biosynthesis protein FliQ [Clostridiales bacterium]